MDDSDDAYWDLPEWEEVLAAVRNFNDAIDKKNNQPGSMVTETVVLTGSIPMESVEETHAGQYGLYSSDRISSHVRGLLHGGLDEVRSWERIRRGDDS